MAYGADHSRYTENKRAVRDKDLGPLVKTNMNRCIQCTRCIRFATEIAGVPELGATSRGENMEITTYVQKTLSSELSGNLVDVCPVGALTSKPYAYVARPWELKKTDSIDVMDAVGSAIRVDTRGPQVMRILPRLNEDINEEWLADKSRHSVDGLMRRRLDKPWLRVGGKLRPATWEEAFIAIAGRMKDLPGRRIGALAGDMADAESMLALKDLMAALGSENVDCRQGGAVFDTARRDYYIFNSTIAGIEEADALLLIGTNPRHEAPILNARIRKRWRANRLPVAVIGSATDLTYPSEIIGAGPDALTALLDGSHAFAEILTKAGKPMIVVGEGALAGEGGAAVLAAAWKTRREGRRFRRDLARLQRAASRGGARRRPRSRLPAWSRGEGLGGDGERRGGCPLAARRRRVRRGGDRARDLRHLPGPSRRPWCRAGRCRAAGGGLYREERHLCEHRGPGPAHGASGISLGRREGGLADHPRLQRGGRAYAAL